MRAASSSMLNAWRLACRGTARTFLSHPLPTIPPVNRSRLCYSTTGPLHPSLRTSYPRWINSKTGQDDADGSVPVSEDGAKNEGESQKEGESEDPVKEKETPKSEEEASSASESSPSEGAPAPPSSSSTPPASGSNTGSNSVIKPTIPSSYPYPLLALPIARRPLFPGFYKAVVIRNPAVVAAIKEMMKRGQPYLGAFLLKDKENKDMESTEEDDKDVIDSLDEVHDVGVFCQVTSVFAAAPKDGATAPPVGPDGKPAALQEEALTAVLYPHRRIRITELVQPGAAIVKVDEADITDVPSTPPAEPVEGAEETTASSPTSFLKEYPISLVRITNLPTEPYTKDNQHIRAFTSEIVSVFKDIAQLNPLFRDQITNFSINQVTSANIFDEPDKLADFAAAVSSGEPRELQDVLESTQVEDRLRKALLVLKKELINAELQSKLARDVDSKIAKRQREYYLMEQMRGIKRELGLESDGKDKLIQKFKERAATLNMPPLVRKVFDEELQKLQGLEPAASEANVTRNYLDWLTVLPWGVHTPENYDLGHAREVLDKDHYGLKQVKDRILEFLAVGKLRGSVEGKIICLVGPPGVGKTSVGKSIAHCVGRRFVRFSVGGLTDVAEIKGHRRTYVGALPGKIVQSLKRVGTENPVVVIDEIDKIGRGHNGDPASALLEMLDPEQNGSFLDHYLDVPVDLSRVLFVCTANTLDTIPAPLLDRMEVLEVSGYVSEEKSVIARKYLAPQAKESCGLGNADVEIDESAVDVLIKWYARESGVRNLKKYIEKIYRKAALKIVEQLGEEAFPEPKGVVGASASKAPEAAAEKETSTPESEVEPKPETSSTTPESESTPEPAEKETPSAESSEGANKPSDAEGASTSTPKEKKVTDPEPSEEQPKETTTKERKPMVIPDTVHLRITPENLKEYVGPPVYQRDRMFGGSTSKLFEENGKEKTKEEREQEERERVRTLAPPGVSTGLGYLGNGSGAVMPIEAVSMPGKGSLQLTGKLGEVIRESAQIALSWVKAHAYELGVTKSPSEILLENRDVHIHMPEGAVGKDGPSAGTAILTALVSLVSGRRVDGDIAMTGEMSLTGRVLAVGGLKEKILAAHRAEIKTILVPGANRMDVEENVPESVKEGIRFVYVEGVEEVLKEVFGMELGKKPEGESWKRYDEKKNKEEKHKEEKSRKEKEGKKKSE
ncbi:ATP-dependent protease La [Ephemerocybe angulata]|uniref:Lon protease homolog, mitochondrial n=1 Tax=Ephemerocybe angulata TaxID=980116 RepID=A0A8H6HDP0_9AGAR|nr:ATP-dependent protease La [Tulosesus angulatus]